MTRTLRMAGAFTVLFAALAPRVLAHPLDGRALPTLGEYFTLGVEHILTGYDHLLFVAGLVIATTRLRGLLWTVSAFTVAHSVTLALGMLGVVTPNGTVVEVLIALSIAYVGYENLRTREPKGRLWIVLGFGLAHGFGFAGAIREIGLPLDRELSALACFNLGVEAGQLGVIAFLWPLLGLVRRAPRAERVGTQLVNVVLIVAGLGWVLERSVAAPEPARSAAPVVKSAED